MFVIVERHNGITEISCLTNDESQARSKYLELAREHLHVSAVNVVSFMDVIGDEAALQSCFESDDSKDEILLFEKALD